MPEAARSTITEPEAGGSPAASLIPNTVIPTLDDLNGFRTSIKALQALKSMISSMLFDEGVDDDLVTGIDYLFDAPIDQLASQLETWRELVYVASRTSTITGPVDPALMERVTQMVRTAYEDAGLDYELPEIKGTPPGRTV